MFRAAIVLYRLLVRLPLWYIGYVLYNVVSIVSCLPLNDLPVIFLLAHKFLGYALCTAFPYRNLNLSAKGEMTVIIVSPG